MWGFLAGSGEVPAPVGLFRVADTLGSSGHGLGLPRAPIFSELGMTPGGVLVDKSESTAAWPG